MPILYQLKNIKYQAAILFMTFYISTQVYILLGKTM